MRPLSSKARRAAALICLLTPAAVASAASCSHPYEGQMSGGSNGSTSGNGGGGSGGAVGNAGGGSGDIGAGSGNGGGGSGDIGAGSGNGGGGSASGGGPTQQTTDGAAPTAVKMACGDAAYSDPFTPGYKEDPAVASQAQSIVSGMTLAQQASQMRGTPSMGYGNFTDYFRTPDDTTAKVAGFAFRDGPRGICLAAELPSGKNGYSTSFPVPSGRGATFDLALEEQVGEAIGDEMLASRTQFGRANTMLLAPVINLLRHPAWGRAEETYGEDSYLLGRFGSAFTVGAQTYAPTCAKHYAGNNIEKGRESDNELMDERTLREMYARHFGAVVRDGGVSCIMASYNLVNGTKATVNGHLLTDILRTDFGFKGLSMSDWWAMNPGSSNLGTVSATVFQQNAVAGVTAGLDMELPWSLNYAQIEGLVPGQISANAVKTSATRIVEQKLRFKVDGIGGQPGLKAPTTSFDSTNSIANNDAHIALAQKVAIESMVLLKNDKSTLPVDRTKVKTVAVLGAQVQFVVSDYNGGAPATINFATDLRLGDLGSSRTFSDPAKSSGPYAGIKEIAGSGVSVITGSTAAAAKNADFVVVVAGLTPQDEGEEYTGANDRFNFGLDYANKNTTQNDLITAVAALGKPMVVVLEGGSVIDMPWLSSVPAVVMAWYPGMEAGRAMGKLLFGDTNFSGKLPVTWPKAWADEPPFAPGTMTADYHVGYSWFDYKAITPLFAFGSGLSYASFKYAYVVNPCSSVTKNGVVSVQVGITNTGSVVGDEVAFMFVSYPTGVMRPAKELKGFYRAAGIAPGQTAQVTMPLRVSDLQYWDTTSNSWQVQSGTYKIMIGPSSDNLTLTDTFTIP